MTTPPWFDEVRSWLPADGDPARPLIALSTVAPDGYPDTRHVLLSDFDEQGFFFHTDARSRKLTELRAAPRASFAIAWPELRRQLVVVGDTESASAEEATTAYQRRSYYLQVLAWLNDAEFARLDPAEGARRWAEFEAAHPYGTLTPPATWAGIRIAPTRVTLWHGHPDTASRRTEYTLVDGDWHTSTLPG
ncbi:pyridoxine/pyridoxamine 5'-phosphate oxidase [Subtercola sp. YIM 133946]|uniref:pyridoxine/pyridoxamine 5'-phosphate oxidase n=1 Tax=Subtercola sp. YIM 133946 TaxID=3118909 RepID=UPI002F949A88